MRRSRSVESLAGHPRPASVTLGFAALALVAAAACAAPRLLPTAVTPPATSVIYAELLPGATRPAVPTPRVFGPTASPSAFPAVASPSAAPAVPGAQLTPSPASSPTS
jgi:hypothetical protein